MVDVLCPSRLKDMSNFLEDEWLSPEPVRCIPLPQLPIPPQLRASALRSNSITILFITLFAVILHCSIAFYSFLCFVSVQNPNVL
jgi:hypothetical protein